MDYLDVVSNAEEFSGNEIPVGFELLQNYPNPFNPETLIGYQLPVSSKVTLVIYDILGREIATLADEEQGAGSHTVKFNGERFPSGIYLYRITAGDHTAIKKMVLLE